MLIKCPECNKDVSDKAEFCPNCGYKICNQKPVLEGVYCPKCLKSSLKGASEECPFCNIKYKDSITGTIKEIYAYPENHPELKESPEFSQEAYNKRINYVPYEYPTVNTPKCPTCGSTNIRKISGVERGASIAVFGLFSKKINKTFKCGNCGYTW